MSEHVHSAKKYYLVFIALMILSLATVGASYINFGVAIGIAIALTIATVKSSLVASFFMHLVDEKKLVYYILICTAGFFIAMMFLFIAAYYDPINGTEYLNKKNQPKIEKQHHSDSHGGGHGT